MPGYQETSRWRSSRTTRCRPDLWTLSPSSWGSSAPAAVAGKSEGETVSLAKQLDFTEDLLASLEGIKDLALQLVSC